MPRNKRPKPRLKRVSIRVEKREEPDWDRFAWALLQHAKIVSERQAQKKKRKP